MIMEEPALQQPASNTDAGAPHPAPSPRAKRRTALAILLFVSLYITYVATPTNGAGDTSAVIPIAISLALDGDMELSEFAEIECPPVIQRGPTRSYSFFPWGPGAAAAPIVGALSLLMHCGTVGEAIYELGFGPVLLDPDDGVDARATMLRDRNSIERAAASTCSTLALLFSWLLLRRWQGDAVAAGAVLVWAFGSWSWTVCSRAMWQHSPSIAFNAATLFLLSLPGASWRRSGLTGVLVGLGYVMRPTNAVVVLALTIFVAARRGGQLLPFLVGGALVGGVFFATNQSTYGEWLPEYFKAGRLDVGNASAGVLVDFLFSPARGLFIYCPFLLLAPVALAMQLRRGGLCDIACISWLIICGHILAVSCFDHWWGGHSWGPRLLSDLQPFLAVALIPTRLAATPRRPARWFLLLAALLGSLSVVIQTRYFDPAAARWNADPISVDLVPSRIGDWRDPPFLRGTPWDGRRELLMSAGDEIAFPKIGPLTALESSLPVPLPPGRHEVVLRVWGAPEADGLVTWEVLIADARGARKAQPEKRTAWERALPQDLTASCTSTGSAQVFFKIRAEDGHPGFQLQVLVRRLK